MIKIRYFSYTDNQSLIEIAKNLGVPARVKIGVDRSPDFFAFNRMISDKWNILVAEEDGQIIGFLEMNDIDYRINGQIIPGIYFGLAGIRQDKRRKSVFLGLMNEVQRIAYNSDRKIAIALINDKNKRLDQVLKQRYPQLIKGQKIIIIGILPFRYYRTDKYYKYSIACEQEFPEIIDLLNKYRNNYPFGIVTDWNRLFSLPGVSLNNILVAKSDKRIVSVLGLWNQSSFRRIRMLGADNLTLGALLLLKILRPTMRVSDVPSKGDHIRFIYGFAVAAEKGFESAFSGLLRFAISEFSYLNYHLFMLGLPKNDPCLQSVSGLIKIININIPIIFTHDDYIKQGLTPNHAPQIWLEYALT